MIESNCLYHLLENLKDLDVKNVKVFVCPQNGVGVSYSDPLSGGLYYKTEITHYIPFRKFYTIFNKRV